MIKQFTLLLSLGLLLGCGSQDRSTPTSLPNDSGIEEKPTEDPVAIVEAAIGAHGANEFEKIKAGTFTVFTRGYVSEEMQDEITTTCIFQFPNQVSEKTTSVNRWLKADLPPSTFNRSYLCDGRHAWEREGDGQYRPTSEVRRVQNGYPLRLISELLMLRNGDVSLLYVGEEEVAGRAVIVIRLTREGQTISEIAFDKATKLLAKISMVSHNPKARRMGQSETCFSDYRSFSGLLLPTKEATWLDGEIFVEKTLNEFAIMEEVDSRQFTPGGAAVLPVSP